MSLIDPDAAEREKRSRPATARELVVPILVAFLLPLVAALLATRMLSNAIGNDAFDGFSVLALVVDVPLVGVLVFTGMHWWGVWKRNPKLPDVSLMVALALLGLTLGNAISAPPPGWVQPPAPSWTLLLGVVGSIGIVVLDLVMRRYFDAKDAREDEVMRAAPPVTAVVTNKGYDRIDSDTSGVITRVTYSFVDHTGTQRWAKLGARIPASDPLLDGEKVDLWFDRDDPADVKRIIVRRRGGSLR